jgi:hypothetical protein
MTNIWPKDVKLPREPKGSEHVSRLAGAAWHRQGCRRRW